MNLNKCNDLNMMNIIILIVMSRRKARSTLYFVILLQDFRILNKYETVDNCHFAHHHHQQQQTPSTVKTAAVIKLPIIVIKNLL